MKINASQASQRLDKTLSHLFKDVSRAQIQKSIRNSLILINQATVTNPAHKVQLDDTLTGTFLEQNKPSQKLEPFEMPLEVHHEDEDIIVINKPAFLVVHPAPGHPNETLVNALIAHCGTHLAPKAGFNRPGIVHRIDKDTSGLLVIAKTDGAYDFLKEQFTKHTIERHYQAIVWGRPLPLKDRIETLIARHHKHRKKMCVPQDGEGRLAITHYRVLKTINSAVSLIECKLETGRTHQIRVHLSHKGHALVGDPVYRRKNQSMLKAFKGKGIQKALTSFPRQALHAKTLGFTHPNGQELLFNAPLPQDMEALWSTIKRENSP